MNIFILAGVIAFTFFVLKFVELKMTLKKDEQYPFKLLVKDTLVVFSSVVMGNYLAEQLMPAVAASEKGENVATSPPQVFLDNPEF